MVTEVGWQQFNYKHQAVSILRMQMSGLDGESDSHNVTLDQDLVPSQMTGK